MAEARAILAGTLALLWGLLLAEASAAERVPFVGCAGDGQTGPVDPPVGEARKLALARDVADALAFYQGDEDAPGVLAPRGWNCFYWYGSDGGTLVVAPRKGFEKEPDFRLDGPAVVVTIAYGDTSGRITVARYAARLFRREESKFIKRVLREGIVSAKDLPSGPYPADKLTYKGPRRVEYETPANADGLGTSTRLIKNGDPVAGVAMLLGEVSSPNLLLVAARLPPELLPLKAAIVGSVGTP